MNPDTRIPSGEPGLRENPERRDAGREQPPVQEQEPRKERTPKESQDGAPGYGESPPEVRREKLPDQGW
jgi:hypothetical protein